MSDGDLEEKKEILGRGEPPKDAPTTEDLLAEIENLKQENTALRLRELQLIRQPYQYPYPYQPPPSPYHPWCPPYYPYTWH